MKAITLRKDNEMGVYTIIHDDRVLGTMVLDVMPVVTPLLSSDIELLEEFFPACEISLIGIDFVAESKSDTHEW